MSLTLEEVNMIINQNIKDPAVKAAMINDAKEIEADKKAEKAEDKGPKSKNRYVICVRGDAELKKTLQAGWVLKVPENSDNNTVVERMRKSAKAQNEFSKSKKMKLFKWLDFFGNCKRKNTKPNDIQQVTKEAVEIIMLEDENIFN